MTESIEAWAGILIQVPLVAAFIWYSLEMQKRFSESLDKRDAAYEQRNTAIVNSINANTAQVADLTRVLTAHDARRDRRATDREADR